MTYPPKAILFTSHNVGIKLDSDKNISIATSYHLVQNRDFLGPSCQFSLRKSRIDYRVDTFLVRIMAAAASTTLRQQKTALRKTMRTVLTNISNDEIQAQCQCSTIFRASLHAASKIAPLLRGFSGDRPSQPDCSLSARVCACCAPSMVLLFVVPVPYADFIPNISLTSGTY